MNTEITDNKVEQVAWISPRPARLRLAGAGEAADRGRNRWADWLPLAFLAASALPARRLLPPWVFMWALSFAIFFGCKWLTWRRAAWSSNHPGIGRTLAYLLLWPGMDAAPFLVRREQATAERRDHASRRPSPFDWFAAAMNTLLGAVLFILMAHRASKLAPLARGWVGMVGLILFLHFGTFELLALGWNRVGVHVQPLMRSPLSSKSLGEFWSARWNTAFNALAHDLAFRSLARRWGVPMATLLVFAISGLIHDAVISRPARGGYGLPTAYFIVQGLGVLLERSNWGRRIGLGQRWRGRFFTIGFAAGPAFWLFHPTFVRNVILPMLDAIGAT